MKIKSIIFFLFLILSLIFIPYICCYNPIISSQCHKDGSTASIVWKRTLPFFLVDGYLIIKDATNGKIIFKKLLVKGRDHYGDLQVEFIGILWDCEKITIELNRNHYKGPTIIEFESTDLVNLLTKYNSAQSCSSPSRPETMPMAAWDSSF